MDKNKKILIIKRDIKEREKMMSNIIFMYVKKNKYKNFLNFKSFFIYNIEKFITIGSKNI